MSGNAKACVNVISIGIESERNQSGLVGWHDHLTGSGDVLKVSGPGESSVGVSDFLCGRSDERKWNWMNAVMSGIESEILSGIEIGF